MMELTSFQRFFPPALVLTGAPNPPLGIARAPEGKPSRVQIENAGATGVFVGGTEQDVQNPEGTSSAVYLLFPGQSRVFVLAPSQTLFALGVGAGAILSVSVSDAIPIGFERDTDGRMRAVTNPLSGGGSPNPAWKAAIKGQKA